MLRGFDDECGECGIRRWRTIVGLSCHPKNFGLHDDGDNETTKNFCRISRNRNRIDLGFKETLFSILLGMKGHLYNH